MPKDKDYYCECCEKYYDKSFLKKDVLGKQTCELCIKNTHDNEPINKKDAIYSKPYDALFKPADVSKCGYSKEYYPLKDLVKTSGSDKIIAKKFLKKCKYSGLTFTPGEMATEDTSALIHSLKEIETQTIKFAKLKEAIPKNKVEFSENKKWAIVKIKGFLRSKYLLYNKEKHELQTL